MAGMMSKLRDALVADSRGVAIGRGSKGRAPELAAPMPSADSDVDDMGGPSDSDADDPMPEAAGADFGGPDVYSMGASVPIPKMGDRKIAPEDGPGFEPDLGAMKSPMPDVPMGDDADMDRDRAIQAVQGKFGALGGSLGAGVAGPDDAQAAAAAALRAREAAGAAPGVGVAPGVMQGLAGAGGQKVSAAFDELGLPAASAAKGGLAGLFGRMTPAPRPPADSLAAVLARAALGARRR